MKKTCLLTSVVIASCVLVDCSQQDSQPAPSNPPSAPSTPSANAPGSSKGSIALLNIYNVRLDKAGYVLTELQNNGRIGIKAFQGKWTVTDDLDAKVADDIIRYTSDTQFVNTNGLVTAHVIAPGEMFVVVEQTVVGQPDNVFVVAEKDYLAPMNPIFALLLKERTWEQLKVKKKTTFELQKVVNE